jgi:hypothetical protein
LLLRRPPARGGGEGVLFVGAGQKSHIRIRGVVYLRILAARQIVTQLRCIEWDSGHVLFVAWVEERVCRGMQRKLLAAALCRCRQVSNLRPFCHSRAAHGSVILTCIYTQQHTSKTDTVFNSYLIEAAGVGLRALPSGNMNECPTFLIRCGFFHMLGNHVATVTDFEVSGLSPPSVESTRLPGRVLAFRVCRRQDGVLEKRPHAHRRGHDSITSYCT